ncbi:hypothetical protein SAMD00019534_110400 [Acytostelium subglobosum LB1]|uniref:hypothetical protein n=1 Tax=Acytostelium subglobosum LB1 TaxID=1410327 RepID=UPI0006448B51|nr:hypothetical protein SAMD00019534_110400 [Acytostelium subglobosum LB1]GAM27864.1 hypothetical protein SAMD00019534_110400 [Acytostelium subglobosum LB1]|eukprot:XP_012749147.1 hypothetical protein SAMD00019534_110400 [Acytostelium subglobosum LB1]
MGGGKKFGINSKAEEARAKKAEVKKNDNEKKQREKEDAEWQETDAKMLAKQKKAKELEEKKAQEAKRKAENKLLLDSEETELKQKYGKGVETKKLTRFEIEQQKEREQREREKQQQLQQQQQGQLRTSTTSTTSTSSTAAGDDDDEDTFDLQENINHVFREQRMREGDNMLEARGVGEAIKVLSGSNANDDHPEKRMKAAYEEYETKNLSLLRKENPSLRFTQIKQLLWKQWLKAPENPFNQVQPTTQQL